MRLGDNSGFTIIETMLFLAISAGLIVIAVAAIGGRTQQVQFQEGLRGFESFIEQVYSDTANGTAFEKGNCRYVGGSYDFSQPSDGSCIFLGYMIELPDSSLSLDDPDKSKVIVQRMVGRRLSSSELSVCPDKLACVEPVADNSANSSYEYSIDWGAKIDNFEILSNETISNAIAVGSLDVNEDIGALGYLRDPSSGNVTFIAVFEGTDYKNNPAVYDDSSNQSVKSGSFFMAIGCMRNSTNDLRASVVTSSSGSGRSDWRIEHEMSEQFTEDLVAFFGIIDYKGCESV